MQTRFSRRQVSAAMLGTVAGVALGAGSAAAQTPQPAHGGTPAVAADLFSGVMFQPGVVPTIYGDVTLPSSVERVVTITDGAMDAMTALGITPVGVTSSANFETVAHYLEDLVNDDLIYIGGWGELDIEGIIVQQPDLILADRYLAEDQYNLLSGVAPVVATGAIDVSGPDALQQWEYELLVWGYAVGREDEAKQAILGLRERAAQLKIDLGGHVGQSVVVFRPQPEFPVVMSHAWITGVTLSWAGLNGNELTESTDPPHTGDSVSLERLDLLEADWLFAATRDEAMSAALETYFENPVFQTLSAVQNDQVVQVAGDLWSGATGVLAGQAMLDDIRRILVDGDGTS